MGGGCVSPPFHRPAARTRLRRTRLQVQVPVRTARRTTFGRLVPLDTCKGVIVTITDRMAAWRRERRVLQRVSQAARRLEQAERERAWAPARRGGSLDPQTGGRGGSAASGSTRASSPAARPRPCSGTGQRPGSLKVGRRSRRPLSYLMINVIVLWQTVYIQAALDHLAAKGYPIDPADVARLTPLGHPTINLDGRYRTTNRVSAENLRHLGRCFAGRRRLGHANGAWRAGLGSGRRAMIFGLWA
jgi:Tn3 transposase DDE domain